MKVVKPDFSGHRRTVKDVLKVAAKEGFKEVIVMGYDTENRPTLIGGNMRNADALWLLEWAKAKVGPV